MSKFSLVLYTCTLLPGIAIAFHANHRWGQGAIPNSSSRSRSNRRSCAPAAGHGSRTRELRPLRAFPNEYETFFNKACQSGSDAIQKLGVEERAKRAREVRFSIRLLSSSLRFDRIPVIEGSMTKLVCPAAGSTRQAWALFHCNVAGYVFRFNPSFAKKTTGVRIPYGNTLDFFLLSIIIGIAS